MNRLENKGGGCLIVNATEEEIDGNLIIQLDKTYAEIENSWLTGSPVFIKHEDSGRVEISMISEFGEDNNSYCVIVNNVIFIADTKNDYPTMANSSSENPAE